VTALAASLKLKAMIETGHGDKSDPKILLDTIKASGLFEESASDQPDGVSIEQIIADAAKAASGESNE